MAPPTHHSTIVRNLFAILAAFFSVGAALVSILTFAKSEGWVTGRILPADGAAGWVRLSPVADTARSVGDTTHLAATVIDTLGVQLAAPGITWVSSDSTVARVRNDGTVIALAPGGATITARVGKAAGSARIVVTPVAATLRFEPSETLSVGDGATSPLALRALDARGHPVVDRRPSWRSSDTAVARVDSTGLVTGVAPGPARITASLDGVTATAIVTVAPRLGRIALFPPANLRTLPGRTLDPIEVRTFSRQGRPMPGVLLHLESKDAAGEPDGSTGTDSVRTGGQGSAHISWTAGERPGRERLTVSADGLDSTATLVLEVEPVASRTRLALAAAIPPVPAGDSLPAPVAVRVTDSTGRPLADVPVQWNSLDGARVTPVDARTDSGGMARAQWRAGPRSGIQRVSVSVGSGRLVPPLLATVQALPGPPTTLRVVAGADQRGRAGHTLAEAVVVVVTDDAGNPVPGADLQVTPTGGEVGDSALVTDSTGKARIRWMLGRKAGEARLRISLRGTSRRVEVTAIGVPGAAENLTFEGAPSGPTAGPVHLVVVVTDAMGNPVPKVALKATPSAGRVTPTHLVTDQGGRGRFTWTLGSGAGGQKLTVRGLGVEARGVLEVTRKGSTPTRKGKR